MALSRLCGSQACLHLCCPHKLTLFSHDEAHKYMPLESVYVKMIFNLVLFWYQEAEMTNYPSIAYFLQFFTVLGNYISNFGGSFGYDTHSHNFLRVIPAFSSLGNS